MDDRRFMYFKDFLVRKGRGRGLVRFRGDEFLFFLLFWIWGFR